MSADPETLARHQGKPLLSDSGMETIHGLLQAHINYDAAETMHADEINELDQQITELEQRRSGLLAERESEVSKHHSARHTYTSRVERIASRPNRKDNPVYAATLRSIASDGQGKLWYPNTLDTADQIGRSFVEMDEALKATGKPQPALIIERERSSHTNIYIAKTKGSRGLKPTTVPTEEKYGLYGRRDVDRVALAIPVHENRIAALQVHPNTLTQQASLADCAYDRGPHLRDNVSDAFKIVLPRGLVWSASILGGYDRNGQITEVYSGNEDLFHPTSFQLAIGKLSVTKALEGLLGEFVTTHGDQPYNYKTAFDLLKKVALGEAKLPQPSQQSRRSLRIERSFSVS